MGTLSLLLSAVAIFSVSLHADPVVRVEKVGGRISLIGACDLVARQLPELELWKQKMDGVRCYSKKLQQQISSTGPECRLDVTDCIPRHVMEFQDQALDSNCFNLALHANSLTSQIRTTTPLEFSDTLAINSCSVIPVNQKPEPGDILAVRIPHVSQFFGVPAMQEIHGMIYVSEDLVYSKNSEGRMTSIALQDRRTPSLLYTRNENLRRCGPSDKSAEGFSKENFARNILDESKNCVDVIRCQRTLQKPKFKELRVATDAIGEVLDLHYRSRDERFQAAEELKLQKMVSSLKQQVQQNHLQLASEYAAGSKEVRLLMANWNGFEYSSRGLVKDEISTQLDELVPLVIQQKSLGYPIFRHEDLGDGTRSVQVGFWNEAGDLVPIFSVVVPILTCGDDCP